jgi:UDP-glucose 4-epimerase
MKKILITGANGYIGSCLFHFLIKKFKVIGIDKDTTFNNKIYKCNLLDSKKLDQILKKEQPEIIIHLAAQSLVDETINKKKYYDNNVSATSVLLKVMKKNNIKKIIFSSTAAVYKKSSIPLKENSILKPISTYAKTKLMCEKKINRQKNMNFIILRFFNVCSALSKPVIGEFHNPETHLIPTIVYKTLYKKKIYIYGNDFKTPDGTCIRDYIHIKDICNAIRKSIKYLLENKRSTLFNIGNHKGLSNKNVITYINNNIKKDINLEYVNKRKGDVSKLICDSSKVRKLLKWNAVNSSLKNIINDEIKWIKKFKKIGLKRTFKNYL